MATLRIAKIDVFQTELPYSGGVHPLTKFAEAQQGVPATTFGNIASEISA